MLNVTATVNTTYLELQKQFGNNQPAINPVASPVRNAITTPSHADVRELPHKDSLSFSRDHTNEDFKNNWAIGKIKHQLQAQKDDYSSRGDTNPEDVLHYDSKKVRRAVSTHFPKNFRKR